MIHSLSLFYKMECHKSYRVCTPTSFESTPNLPNGVTAYYTKYIMTWVCLWCTWCISKVGEICFSHSEGHTIMKIYGSNSQHTVGLSVQVFPMHIIHVHIIYNIFGLASSFYMNNLNPSRIF